MANWVNSPASSPADRTLHFASSQAIEAHLQTHPKTSGAYPDNKKIYAAVAQAFANSDSEATKIDAKVRKTINGTFPQVNLTSPDVNLMKTNISLALLKFPQKTSPQSPKEFPETEQVRQRSCHIL